MKSNKRAFTLAEVLTTLMVIGIVAALTIPNLMNNYKKHTYTVAIKRMYSVLTSAIKMAPTEVGCEAGNFECDGFFQWYSTERYNLKFTEALANQLRNTELRETGGCIAETSKNPCIILSDGSWISHNLASSQIGSSDLYQCISCYIFVDTNGFRGPNEWGRDKFAFFIATETKNGMEAGQITPAGSKMHAIYRQSPTTYWKESTGGGCRDGNGTNTLCTGRLFEEGKMNY